MQKGRQINAGETRIVFATEDPTLLIQEFTDSAPGGAPVASRGVCNNCVSSVLFKLLAEEGIPTHFMGLLNDREMLVRKLTLHPVKIVVRNIAAGDFSKRLGIPEGEILPSTIVEFYLREEAPRGHAAAADQAGIATTITEGEVKVLQTRAADINRVLQKFFSGIGLVLADFRLDFGRDADGHVLVGGELSPDSCRLWYRENHEKLDKDRFRRDLGGTEEAYQEVLRRVTGNAGPA